jgi:hypothetical protein
VTAQLPQHICAEALGTAFLLAAVVGSGIMAQKLSGGNLALALLGNTLPTGAILVVLILIFAPVSGAHFNPAVSLAFALRGELTWQDAAAYIAVQIAGGIVGVWAAHLMFELPVWQLSLTARTGGAQWFAEFVATFGLLLTLLGCVSHAPRQWLTRSVSTSQQHIGSQLRHRSPIRPSRSRARSPTPSLELRLPTFSPSSPPKSAGRWQLCYWDISCGLVSAIRGLDMMRTRATLKEEPRTTARAVKSTAHEE